MAKRQKPKEKQTSVSVWFDPGRLAQLDKLAARDDRSRSAWIRVAVETAMRLALGEAR